MSTNFTGITFAQQKVAPSDDARVRRVLLHDGILTGCELSYSGSTLTMASGQLMICGRQIRHPAAQNWAVVDATSGYARLLLTIDLTRTATKDTFDQVVDTIEYATSIDGFPTLEQTDINGAGTRYQTVACVVSLGTGGISGIVSQLSSSHLDASSVGARPSTWTPTMPETGLFVKSFSTSIYCAHGASAKTTVDISVPGYTAFALVEAGTEGAYSTFIIPHVAKLSDNSAYFEVRNFYGTSDGDVWVPLNFKVLYYKA